MESHNTTSAPAVDIRNSEDFKQCINAIMEQLDERVQLLSSQVIQRIDAMGERIDGLERSVAELMTSGPLDISPEEQVPIALQQSR